MTRVYPTAIESDFEDGLSYTYVDERSVATTAGTVIAKWKLTAQPTDGANKQGIGVIQTYLAAQLSRVGGTGTINIAWETSEDDITYANTDLSVLSTTTNAYESNMNSFGTDNAGLEFLIDGTQATGYIRLRAYRSVADATAKYKQITAKMQYNKPFQSTIARII